MGKLVFVYIIVISFYFNKSYANDTLLNLNIEQTIPGSFTNCYVDNLGNIYLISATNQIKKLNSNLDSVAVFNDIKHFGTIDFIDVSNPLKILVFYKAFSTITILDRFLSKKQTIDLRAINIQQAACIAQGYDNTIWVYDELDASIKKIDDFGKLLTTSTSFRMLFDEAVLPTNIIDKDGLLYLYSKNFGWLIFDYYGALKTKVMEKNWSDVQVINKTLFGHNHQELLWLQPTLPLLHKRHFNINLKDVQKLIQSNGYFYTLTSKGVTIYSY
ncbi:MAG TPA: hypothetical protein PLY81_04975 [Chitinophagaceae bacterium]|nr:hypothetical protein [Chitinophagaceae bacterium]HNJ59371.1 hypothetical protein [Chitinophagaceae bacterium]HNM34167.1 hypothetical protein [Chitinophagaceae bacterium]HNN30433.1 hypothetical protein [Chitinophagaceae bacterium]